MANRATWSKRVADWKASGLTAAEFAIPHGWSPATLRWWSSQLKRTPPRLRQDDMRFVRLVAGAARPITPPPPCEPPPIVVELGVARLVLARGFDRTDLATVLDLLQTTGAAR